MTHPLAAAQQSLADASKAAWDAVEQDLRARPPRVHGPGARLVFVGLDPTLQLEHHRAGRSIVLRHGDERFLFPLDKKLAKRISELRDLQITFGWPIARETAWNVVADIVETRELEQSEPPVEGAPTREHELVLRQIYVPGQLMLDSEVPGLEAAQARLQALLPTIVVPGDARPERLVAALPAILRSNHWKAFELLCDDALARADRRMAFEQMRQAWQSSGGFTLDSTEGEPERAAEGEIVRTLLRRSGTKAGEVLVRPLLWVRRGDGWRFAGGIL